MSYQLTKIKSLHPQTLTKSCWLDDAGIMQRGTVAEMTRGHADLINLDTPAQFAELLAGLQPNEALCYGVAPAPSIALLSKKKFEEQGSPANATTRTKANFKWPAAGGVLMLDYDPAGDQAPLTKAQLLATLAKAVPALATCAYVWWASSSSLICNSETNEQLTSLKGQRVYLFVQDATDIERAGAVLFKRLWLAGQGYYALSSSGSLLERTPIDASVWQTNRLDFAAGAHCIEPLEQRRAAPAVHDGEVLDTRAALPDLTEAELADYAARKAQAKEDVAPERAAIRGEYIERTALAMLAKQGREATEQSLDDAARTVERALDGGVLAGDFILTLANGDQVTVGEALDNPSRYHHALTRDPLEPEYNGGKVTGRLYLIGGRANLHSFAHGGRTFKLIRQVRNIEHRGGTTAETTNKTMELLRQLPDVFDYGEQLALVERGELKPLNQDSLSFYLGNVAQYFQLKKVPNTNPPEFEPKNLDPSVQMLKHLLALGSGRQLKPLKAVITAPIIDLSGRVITKAGYDAKAELYLDLLEDAQQIPSKPTEQDVSQAVADLMQPFNSFATATALDRGALLAAILTAIVRPVLTMAPAIGLDAPVQGTGKTYLAQCLAMLATGEQTPVMPHTASRDDEETRKRLFAVLLAGARVMIWDNILGHFDSAALASLITSDIYEDRKLGASEKSKATNRLFVLLTGNNLAFAGDMPSRVLKIRLDTQLENPAARKFDSNPLEYIKEHRLALVRSGLIIIKAYLGSGRSVDRATRFDDWDMLARQPVVWLNTAFGLQEFGDPADVLADAANTDPEKEALQDALTLIHEAMGGSWWETRELLKRADGTGLGRFPNVELAEALQELAGGGPLSNRGLGRVLGYRVDRWTGGMKLVKRTGGRVAKFKIEIRAQQKPANLVNF